MATARRLVSAVARCSMRPCRIVPSVAPRVAITSKLTTPNACSSVRRGGRIRILGVGSAARCSGLTGSPRERTHVRRDGTHVRRDGTHVRRERRGSARTARNGPSVDRACGARPSRIACPPMLLEGRKLLITGVLTDRSIAYFVARRAQEEGAEVVLTGFGRGLRITERMAKRLPTPADVLELDVNDPAQLEAVASALDERWGRLDGLLHAI